MKRLVFGPAVVCLLALIAAPPGPARGAEPDPAQPRVWAVTVGIERHDDQTIPRCRTAVRDARAVGDWFRRTAGWGRDHVLALDDRGDRDHGATDSKAESLRPTRDNLDWAVGGWLAHRVRPGDVAVIYFAGQATTLPPRSGSPAGRGYLLPIDAAAGDVAGTGWSIEDALDRSGVAAKARVLIWLDTSPLGRGESGLPRAEGAADGSAWLGALARWPGVSAWLASDFARVAEPGVPGPFVAALLRGLGTGSRAHTLVGCLESMRSDPALAGQGFRAVGGIDPSATLWPDRIRPVELALPELIVQTGHGDRVTALRATADGALLISASQDSTVRVWDRAGRSLVRVLAEPMNGVSALALNRDGTTLLAGDGLGRVVGWDMTRDRPRSVYGPPEHPDGITALAFLPDGRRFVALDRGGKSTVWEADAGALRKLRDLSDAPLARLAATANPGPGGAAVVAAGEDGSLVGFDAEAAALPAPIAGPGPAVTALDLAADGRSVAVGDESGRLRVLDIAAGPRFDQAGNGPVRLARFHPAADRLLVADGDGLRLVEPRAGGKVARLDPPPGTPAPGAIELVAFPPDGRRLAAIARGDGRVLLWDLSDIDAPRPVPLEGPASGATAATFTADAGTLYAGGSDGSIRSWTLDAAKEVLAAKPGPILPAARGRVAGLDVAPDGSAILELTRDDVALLWTLEDRRGARPLPGAWVAGAIVPKSDAVALAAHPDRGGDVVLVDRATGKARATKFARPPGTPGSTGFGAVAASRSGRWVAAASLEAQAPLACVWDAATGALVAWTRIHDAGLTGIAFSGDDRFLLTASADGTARVWPLDGAGGGAELRPAAAVLRNPHGDEPAITAARFSPADPRRVAVGTRGGRVLLWDWKGPAPRVVADRDVDGAVESVAFSADGGWLAASAARERTIRFWSGAGGEAPRAEVVRPAPHHAERVGALAAWSDGTRIVSGGDDGAVRFWDLGAKALVGTLVASATAPDRAEWLAYTPDGLFDGSRPGESLVKWRVGGRVVTLEQAQDTHYAFNLAATFPRPDRPRVPEPVRDTPPVRIVAPPAGRDPLAREFEVTLWTGDRAPADLRLYQNGVPVRGLDDFAIDPARPHFATTRVQLRPGPNRFHALASRPGSADGRSDDLVVGFEGTEPPGRLHILALGVSSYRRRALKYAHIDAKSLADRLVSQGIPAPGGPGERIVLTDDEVNEGSVRDAFARIARAVRDRPEDTVVLFLAGHTDTDAATNRFRLLLPGYPFRDDGAGPEPPEAPAVAARGGPGPNQGGAGADRHVLGFAGLYSRLARLDALRRLIIIDACQAGAVLDDPNVLKIRQVVESSTRKVRNSYLLAARRGEPASEADALRHGLLTYVLLRGLGADGLPAVPDDLGGYPGPASADLDGDGEIGTDELIRYTDATLPKLAQVFPQIVRRAGDAAPPPAGDGDAARTPPPEEERNDRVHGDAVAFPLVRAPR